MVTTNLIPRRTQTASEVPTATTKRIGNEESLQPFFREYQPASEEEKLSVRSALHSFIARMVEEGNAGKIADLKAEVESLIADVEFVLNAQLQEVAKEEKFLKLEGTWRGIIYHHEQTSGGDFRTLLVPATRAERRADLKKKRGFIRKKLGEEEYEQDGGRPLTYVIVNDEFSHANADVDELERWGKLGEIFHFATLASASPHLLGSPSWTTMPDDTENLNEQLDGIAYARWNNFRNDVNSNAAMYVGLSCPRTLARELFNRNSPATGLPFFEQNVTEDQHMCWMNSAFLTAARFGIALRDHGFTLGTTGKRNGGSMDGLPMAAFPCDPAKTPRLPMEVMMSDRIEFFLAEKLRLIPVCGQKNSTNATQFSVNSLQVPATTKDVEESRGAQLRGSLAVLAACCRISHHAKLIARDMIGDDIDDEQVRDELVDFLTDLALNNHKTAARSQRLQRPLRGFTVEVNELNNQTGYYDVQITLVFPAKVKAISGTFHLRALSRKKS